MSNAGIHKRSVVWAGAGLMLAVCLMGTAATAQPVTSGSLTFGGPAPNALTSDAVASDTEASLFFERETVTPASGQFDITTPGIYNDPADLTPAAVTPGQPIRVYLIHADAVTTPTFLNGSVTFSVPVVGMLVDSGRLVNSDAILGSPTTTYETTARGVEIGGAGGTEFVSLSPDRRTVAFNFAVGGAQDQVRIAVVPAPAAASMGLAVLGGMVWRRRRGA